MKKILLIVVLVALLITPAVVFGKASKTVFVEWSWKGLKSAYFMATPSGVVQAWSWGHPEHGDTHWVVKPLDKFPGTTCDAGYVYQNAAWTPRGIYNSAISGAYKAAYLTVFPDLDRTYLLCKYPME